MNAGSQNKFCRFHFRRGHPGLKCIFLFKMLIAELFTFNSFGLTLITSLVHPLLLWFTVSRVPGHYSFPFTKQFISPINGQTAETREIYSLQGIRHSCFLCCLPCFSRRVGPTRRSGCFFVVVFFFLLLSCSVFKSRLFCSICKNWILKNTKAKADVDSLCSSHYHF